LIVTAGEALVDLVEEPAGLRAVAGGGPFNTAVAFGRLDVAVGFVGAISRDPFGEMLVERLVESGVDLSFVARSDAPTPRAVVDRGEDGKNGYTFQLEGTSLTDTATDVLPALPAEVWGVYVGTLALAVEPPASAYEEFVRREAGRRQIVLDPNVRPAIFGDAAEYRSRFERLAQLASLVKLSDDDAAWIYPGVPIDAVLDLILGLGPRIVALTRGEHGAVAASTEGAVEIPGIPVRVADTIGAGDSFGAAFVTALVDAGAFGGDGPRTADASLLARATSYAVAASAVTCTRIGAAPPSRREIGIALAAHELAPTWVGRAADPSR
jgi:fructokinase